MRAWGGRSERACRFSQPGMEEDMIRSRSDLKEYLACERALYFGSGEKNTIEQGGACEGISGAAFLKARLQAWLLRSKFHSIWKYFDSTTISNFFSYITIEKSMCWETAWALRYRKTVWGRG